VAFANRFPFFLRMMWYAAASYVQRLRWGAAPVVDSRK
jgi:hypothetical protein